MHISSSYAKILGEINFHTREFPRSGSKAKDGEKRKRERAKVGDSWLHGARKPPGPKIQKVVDPGILDPRKYLGSKQIFRQNPENEVFCHESPDIRVMRKNYYR